MRIGVSAGLCALIFGATGLWAQTAETAGDAAAPLQVAAADPAAPSAPNPAAAVSSAAISAGPAAETDPPAPAAAARKERCPKGTGSVTCLALPRFVSLKGEEGNARRGPGLTHRIDWVFTRPGMPLMITAEYENWRRVEDQEGAGGWVHYTLLSGARTVLITLDMAEFHHTPDDGSTVVAQAEMGVIGRVLECNLDWCRIALEGQRGWVRKTSIWGVKPDETIE